MGSIRSETLILVLFLTGCGSAADSRIEYISLEDVPVEEFAAKLPVCSPLSSSIQAHSIAHSQYYVLHCLIDRLEYQGDPTVIPELDQAMERILSAAYKNPYDQIRERRILGWSTSRYTEGVNYTWGFHVYKILEPVLRYQRLRGISDIRPFEIMSEFEGDWVEGLYKEPYLEAISPFNMQANICLTDESCALRAGEHLKANLYREDFFTVWNYTSTRPGSEDPEHAMAELKLALRLYKMGEVFSKADVEEMLTTWYNLGFNRDGFMFTSFGSGKLNGRHLKDVCPLMLEVLRQSRQLFEKCY
jgi:hypothetical protein